MTMEEFICKLTKLTDDYEKSTESNNDVVVKLVFFDGSKYILDGEKLVCVRG